MSCFATMCVEQGQVCVCLINENALQHRNILPHDTYKLVPLPGVLGYRFGSHTRHISPVVGESDLMGGAFVVSPNALLHFGNNNIDCGFTFKGIQTLVLWLQRRSASANPHACAR